MRDRKKRNIIIGALCCLLVFMGIGYAILSQTLNISGIANMQGNWSVKITNMKLLEANKTGRATEVSSSYTNTTASFEADLYMPGDSIEYEVTVTNNGNIDAVLNDIKQTKTNQHKDIKFSNSLIGTEVLTAGSTMTFTMKVEFLESGEAIPDIEKTEYKIELVYIQYNGGEYTPPAQSIGTLSDKILADNTAQSDSSIDFSQISSDTNGKGLYYTSTNTEGNKTTLNIVTSDKDIASYTINGKKYNWSSSYIELSGLNQTLTITFYDKLGNSTNVNCNIEYIPYDSPITPSGSETIIASEYTDTLKVWIESKKRSGRTSYYVTHVWAKDPYNQFKLKVDIIEYKYANEKSITKHFPTAEGLNA